MHPTTYASRPEAALVLVVDDDSAIRQLLQFRLSQSGFNVETAESGARAIDLFEREPTAYAAILLDVQMPALDGPQTLTRLR